MSLKLTPDKLLYQVCFFLPFKKIYSNNHKKGTELPLSSLCDGNGEKAMAKTIQRR